MFQQRASVNIPSNAQADREGSSQLAEAGDQTFPTTLSWLHSQFKTSLGYTERQTTETQLPATGVSTPVGCTVRPATSAQHADLSIQSQSIYLTNLSIGSVEPEGSSLEAVELAGWRPGLLAPAPCPKPGDGGLGWGMWQSQSCHTVSAGPQDRHVFHG